MLQDVLETLANKLTLQLNVLELDDEKIHSIEEIVKQYKGKDHLNFVVYDMEEQLKLHMPSRTSKVKISQELLTVLDTKDLKYKLN
jgi:DNA polymerase-3 subunit alpha